MSTESIEQYRAGLEAWARKSEAWRNVPLDRCASGEYRHLGIQGDWTVWVAAKIEASTEPSADQLAQARYSDYVKDCREHGLKPSSFDAYKVVCAEVERDLTVQVLIRCRHPAGALSDDAKDAALYRAMRGMLSRKELDYYALEGESEDEIDAWMEAHNREQKS